jgi:hypothetical protein
MDNRRFDHVGVDTGLSAADAMLDSRIAMVAPFAITTGTDHMTATLTTEENPCEWKRRVLSEDRAPRFVSKSLTNFLTPFREVH